MTDDTYDVLENLLLLMRLVEAAGEHTSEDYQAECQRKVNEIRELCKRLDSELFEHVCDSEVGSAYETIVDLIRQGGSDE